VLLPPLALVAAALDQGLPVRGVVVDTGAHAAAGGTDTAGGATAALAGNAACIILCLAAVYAAW
jgi:hypothetical protein